MAEVAVASVRELDFAYLDLIKAFQKALELALQNAGADEAVEARIAAFSKAKRYGWDWEADEKFASLACTATGPELIANGLACALQNCRIKD